MHRAGADLALDAPERQALAAVDARCQLVVVDEHAVAAQHVRHQVVGEDRETVEIGELGHAGEREVVWHDLSALVETAVVEHRHATREYPGQALGRTFGFIDEVQCTSSGPASSVRRASQEIAERTQRLRVEAHQLVVGALAEDRGDLVSIDL